MKRKLNKKRTLVLLSSCILLIALLCVGGTLAYLKDQTDTAANDFDGAIVNVAVVENVKTGQDGTLIPDGDILEDNSGAVQEYTGDGVYDKNVWVYNYDKADTPTTDAFMRVRLVAILREADGNNAGGIPADQIVYNISSDKWIQQGEYYYYKEAVAPGKLTDQLLDSVQVNPEFIPSGGYVEIQILVDAIQARPDAITVDVGKTPVMEAWEVYPPSL